MNKYITPKLMISGLDDNLINNNLKGNILSVKERNWYLKKTNGKLGKSRLQYSVFYKYDSVGNEILKIEMDKDGWYKGDTIISSHSYKYDQAGRIVEMYENTGPVANDSLFAIKTLCKYNQKGELMEENNYNELFKLDGSSLFTYDTLGNLIVSVYYGHGIFNGSSEKTVFRYMSGKLIDKIYYNPVDTLYYSTAIRYDQNGNRFDEFKEFKYQKVNYTTTTKYDVNGNVIEQTRKNKRGNIIWSVTHEYTYDDRGNWIKEIYAEYGKKPELSERVIEYFVPASGSNK